MPRLRRKVFLKLSPLSLLRRGGSPAQGVRQAQRRASRGGTKAHALRPRPLIAVLLVVLVIFSWYLFGGKFMEKIQEDRANDVENVDPAPVDPMQDDPSDTPVDPSKRPMTPQSRPTSLPAGGGGPGAGDAHGRSLGADGRDERRHDAEEDDSGRFDCTIRMSDSIQLILRGTDAAATWSSEDTSVVTVSADGKLKPVKAGTANVTASVGGATVRCVVRINN